jgi:DNA polymerase III delta prime subunit
VICTKAIFVFVPSMTVDEFLALPAPPAAHKALQALWHDAHGEWDRAHELAQAAADANGDWVHAYLHRKEGDESNAGYWYRRAGRSRPSESLEEELREITSALLGATPK